MKWDITRVKRWIRFYKKHLQEKKEGLDFSMSMSTDIHWTKENHSSYNGYCMTDDETLKEILSAIQIDPQNHNFLDIGCGKGMCLKVACEMDFHKVCGIELDHQIAEIGRRNMRKLNLDAHIFEENAIDFAGYENFDVFYFYNPFYGDVFEKVIEAIVESVKKKPRKIWVAYLWPVWDKLFLEAGFVKCGQVHDRVRNLETYIYEFGQI